jgi:hypothetical protein
MSKDKQIEAMRLALELLEKIHRDPEVWWNCHVEITALREALAEQPAPVQQEPIKWADYEPDGVRRKPLEERLKDAFYEGFTSSATYNDIELNDVDEEWLKYAAVHGITKGNT